MKIVSKMQYLLSRNSSDIGTDMYESVEARSGVACPGVGAWRRALALCAGGGIAVLSLTAARASGGSLQDEAAWREQTASVLELLEADTRRALMRDGLATGPEPAHAHAAARSAPTVDTLRLAALYGTADQLTAVIYVNGVRKEYRPGATLPYGGGGASREYRLQRVLDSCVVLRKAGATRVRSVCFEPAADPASVALSDAASVLDAALPRGGSLSR